MNTGHIKNELQTILTLPTVKGYPPVILGPGCSKSVDAGYLTALKGLLERKPRMRALFSAFDTLGVVKVTAPDSPDIDKALKQPEGPNAPKSLDGIGEVAAKAIVAVEDSADVLRTCATFERRPEIRTAIDTRLASLKPAPVVAPTVKVPGFSL